MSETSEVILGVIALAAGLAGVAVLLFSRRSSVTALAEAQQHAQTESKKWPYSISVSLILAGAGLFAKVISERRSESGPTIGNQVINQGSPMKPQLETIVVHAPPPQISEKPVGDGTLRREKAPAEDLTRGPIGEPPGPARRDAADSVVRSACTDPICVYDSPDVRARHEPIPVSSCVSDVKAVAPLWLSLKWKGRVFYLRKGDEGYLRNDCY